MSLLLLFQAPAGPPPITYEFIVFEDEHLTPALSFSAETVTPTMSFADEALEPI